MATFVIYRYLVTILVSDLTNPDNFTIHILASYNPKYSVTWIIQNIEKHCNTLFDFFSD